MKKALFAVANLVFLAFHQFGYAQLVVDHYPHETELVSSITGEGVDVSNVFFKGAIESKGTFKNSDTPLDFEQGIILSTGEVMAAMGPNKGEGFSGINLKPGDIDLSQLSGFRTYDAAVLEFDFKPKKDVLRFYFSFGSDEYHEYVNSNYNDIFAFFITDKASKRQTNIGVIPGTNSPITINNINVEKNSAFFIENTVRSSNKDKKYTLEYDGLTKRLVAYHQVIPGHEYRIKIAIADAGDDNYDSAVFIEGGSFSSQDKTEFIAENKSFFEHFSLENNPFQVIDASTDELTNETEDNSTSKKKDEVQQKTQEIIPNQPKVVDKPIETNPQFKAIAPLLLHFELNKYELTQKHRSEIRKWMKAIDPNTIDFGIQITGHTDSRGSHVYNQQLSQQRADAVKTFIKTLKPRAFSYNSTGKSFHQLVSNKTTEEAHQENRRVKIELTPIVERSR